MFLAVVEAETCTRGNTYPSRDGAVQTDRREPGGFRVPRCRQASAEKELDGPHTPCKKASKQERGVKQTALVSFLWRRMLSSGGEGNSISLRPEKARKRENPEGATQTLYVDSDPSKRARPGRGNLRRGSGDSQTLCKAAPV